MSNKEINNKLSATIAVLMGCLTAISPLSAEIPNNIMPLNINSRCTKDSGLVKSDIKEAITAMTELIKIQTVLITSYDNIYKHLLDNDQSLLADIVKDNRFPDTVVTLTGSIKTLQQIHAASELDKNIALLLDIIISGALEARYRASSISKLIKQMTVIPRVFKSEVTDDELRAIAEHARLISEKYA